MDSIVTIFENIGQKWPEKFKAAAKRIFYLLALMSLAWIFLGFIFAPDGNLLKPVSQLVQWVGYTGFFLWLLNDGGKIAAAIINSGKQLALGSGQADSASKSLDMALIIYVQTIDKLSASSIEKAFVSVLLVFVAFFILIMMCLMVANQVLITCQAWLVAYGGFLFLGFGGSKWTSDITVAYLKTILKVSMELMMVLLLMSTMNEISADFLMYVVAHGGRNLTLNTLGVYAGVSVVMVILITKVPGMVGSIVSGAGSGGIGLLGAAAIMGGMSAVKGLSGKDLQIGGKNPRQLASGALNSIRGAASRAASLISGRSGGGGGGSIGG